MCEEMGDEFFAGLFSGEGYVTILRTGQGYTLRLGLNMTDRPLVLAIQKSFGGRVVRVDPGHGYKIAWHWLANGSRRSVLEILSRYCTGDKKDQVDLALQYIEEFGEGKGIRNQFNSPPELKSRQEKYYLEMLRLKTVEYKEFAR